MAMNVGGLWRRGEVTMAVMTIFAVGDDAWLKAVNLTTTTFINTIITIIKTALMDKMVSMMLR